MRTKRLSTKERGMACIAAMILLAVFASIVVAFAGMTNTNARMGGNLGDLQQARLAAESGLAFGISAIRGARLPKNTDSSTVLANLAADLAGRLNGTSNLSGGLVTIGANTVYLPRIQTQDGAFDIRIIQRPDQVIELQVMGMGEMARHAVAVELRIVSEPINTAFNFGIASMGPIVLDGAAQIHGKNSMDEASVISVAKEGVAVSLGGEAVIDGDISSVGWDTSVVLNGTPTVAGSQDPTVIRDHVHFGVQAPVFPEVDTSPFKALATTVIDENSDFNGLPVLDNIIIKANTNPTFTADMVLNGVVYVEAPNIVTFAGNVALNGTVATDDSDFGIQACKIKFGAGVQANGVELLPDEPQFTAVKELAGTFIVAPGFDVSFDGEFTTINGTVAADKLTFTGSASGTIRGSVIGLSEHAVTVAGEVNISIDRSGQDPDDPGLALPALLDTNAESYKELIVSDWH